MRWKRSSPVSPIGTCCPRARRHTSFARLRRCLTKDPKLRLRDIGEARIALDLGDDADAAGFRRERGDISYPIAAIATTIALAASVAFIIYRPTPSISAERFHVFPPEGGLFDFHPAQNLLGAVARRIAIGVSRVHRIGVVPTVPARAGSGFVTVTDLEARPLQGTDGATSVFWSPSGRSLAFLADGKLKRFDLPAGPAVTLCDLPDARHGTWGAEDVILLGHSDGRAISAVCRSRGGAPCARSLTPNRSMGDVRVHWPWFLPDGKRFLFTARRDDGEGELRIGQLDGSTQYSHACELERAVGQARHRRVRS